MSTKPLETARYLDTSPEHAKFLKRANRRRLRPGQVRRVVSRTMLLIGFVGACFIAIQARGMGGTGRGIGVNLIRSLRAMIGELNQEQKIWDSI